MHNINYMNITNSIHNMDNVHIFTRLIQLQISIILIIHMNNTNNMNTINSIIHIKHKHNIKNMNNINITTKRYIC